MNPSTQVIVHGFDMYCKCGAELHVFAPAHVVAESNRLFWSSHDGKGHGPCDANFCRTSRLLKEQIELWEG